MTEGDTIADAAQKALAELGRPASITDIFAVIVKRQLYEFNTPNPEHVLRTTVRRHTRNVNRVDSRALTLFEMIEDKVYELLHSRGVRNVDSRGSSGFRRIYRAKDKEEIISALTENSRGVFREIWRLLLFAAQVGVANNRREPLASIDSGKGIDQSTFGNCPSWPGVVYLIGIVETDGSDILASSPDAEEKRLVLFQEYANGGLSLLRDFFQDKIVDLDSLLAFIETQTPAAELTPDLEFTI